MASLIHQNIQQRSIDIIGPKQTTIDLVGGILCNICQLTFATKSNYDIHYRSHGASTEIIYTCNICYKEIIGFPSFRGHCYTSHVIKDRFQCDHCLKQFPKISNLKDHVNRIHKFKCPTCRREFPSKKEMLLHRIIHNGLEQPPYNCTTCKIEIDTADECKDHVEKHLKYLYFCPICNDNISEKENAADHMKEHFGNVLSEDKSEEDNLKSSEDSTEEFSGIMCQFCALILEDRVKFDAHFSCKHGDEDIVYMCVECGKSFEKYSVFKNHCYDHSLRNKYKCQICKKSFPRLSMLAAHTAACQVAGAARGHKVFACPSCSRRFASMSRWREHLRVVHDMHRHLPCPHERCDRIFETPKELILHQQSHEIRNRNFCSQCRLVFPTVASCERHLDMHKKMVFFCPICKRNAKDKKVIMKHISKHFEVVSHICRICGKNYNSTKSLIEHLKTHKKVKSYSCTHCNKSFLKPSQLEQHVNTHTGAKPYKCPICIKSFSNYPNWVKHVRRMHHEESIYIKNPITDRTDSANDDDSAMEKKNIEHDDIKSVNSSDSQICANNKTVNNNDQIPNMEKQRSYTNIELSIEKVQRKKTIDMVINEALASEDEESVNNITVGTNFGISNDVVNVSNNDLASNIEQFPHIESIAEISQNANINFISLIPNHVVIASTLIGDEATPVEITLEEQNGLKTKKKEVEQVSILDEQIANSHVCSKPYKCPICEKSFAKYSYMSKHVGRVHHIRSIDIKNLITDHKEDMNDEGTAMETVIYDETEASTDNTKVDISEQGQYITEKQFSKTEYHIDNDSKPHKCPICDKSFAKHSYVTKHVRKVHHKKSADIKSSIVGQTTGVDEITSMEICVDEENETSTSTDNTKDDSDEQFRGTSSQNQNTDHISIAFKPFKCPLCEKSFAKYPYMTKHVRKIHKKKIVDIKNSGIVHKESVDEEVSAMETSIDGENDIYIDNTQEDNSAQTINSDKEIVNAEHLLSIGSKPYKCLMCEKSFAKHSYMLKHVRTVHNKKVVDIKNPNIDNKDAADDDRSPMETVLDEENDVSTDQSKDDNDDPIFNADKQFINTDHGSDTSYKPYKCPMCEKSFAKDRYCRKHVRRVHYKNNVDIKSAVLDHARSYVVDTSTDKEHQMTQSEDYLNNGISSIESIANIVNQSNTNDCLNDIDDANACLDFANVRMENYIFNVQRDSPMDIVPSMPDVKYVLNENNNESGTISKDLFKDNTCDNSSMRKDLLYTNNNPNAPIVRELFDENGEAIALVEKDLFNANSKESDAVGKNVYGGNSEENDNPIDILEYIAEMPENNSLFVPVIHQEALAPCTEPPAEAVTYPCEYGPEFNTGFDAACTEGFIDLDDHMLPHIDPLLTINNQTCVQVHNYQNYDYNVIDAADLLALGNEACGKMYAQSGQYNEYNVTVAAADYQTGWDPPITKLCDQYAYGYGEMPEASRVPIMNTDIF